MSQTQNPMDFPYTIGPQPFRGWNTVRGQTCAMPPLISWQGRRFAAAVMVLLLAALHRRLRGLVLAKANPQAPSCTSCGWLLRLVQRLLCLGGRPPVYRLDPRPHPSGRAAAAAERGLRWLRRPGCAFPSPAGGRPFLRARGPPLLLRKQCSAILRDCHSRFRRRS